MIARALHCEIVGNFGRQQSAHTQIDGRRNTGSYSPARERHLNISETTPYAGYGRSRRSQILGTAYGILEALGDV